MIYFALAKGRLADESAELLRKCGVDTSVLREDTRKLVLTSADGKYGFFLVKPTDVPTYVEAGVGVENIFRIFRVDCIWRLTHRQPLPGQKVQNFAVNLGIQLKF